MATDNHPAEEMGVGLFICRLDEILQFWGPYAIVSLVIVDPDLGPDDDEECFLCWVASSSLHLPPSLSRKAYRARLHHPTFSPLI